MRLHPFLSPSFFENLLFGCSKSSLRMNKEKRLSWLFCFIYLFFKMLSHKDKLWIQVANTSVDYGGSPTSGQGSVKPQCVAWCLLSSSICFLPIDNVLDQVISKV